MQARLALFTAIACGALAVAAVAVDLAYTLTVSIETQNEEGRWITVAREPWSDDRQYQEPFGFGCAGPELRVIVHNDRPIGASRDVRIWYSDWSNNSRDVTVEDETIELDASDKETYTFTIPDHAFPSENQSADRGPFFGEHSTRLSARVGDLHVSTCVTASPPDGNAKGVPS